MSSVLCIYISIIGYRRFIHKLVVVERHKAKVNAVYFTIISFSVSGIHTRDLKLAHNFCKVSRHSIACVCTGEVVLFRSFIQLGQKLLFLECSAGRRCVVVALVNAV
jgi:hypothetical protein